MNRSNFNQTGGYPLKTERLQELQTAYSIFNALGALAGNLTIISGCAVAGSDVGDGYVYINGELLEFKGGAFDENSTVIIIEEAVNRAFKNGVVKQVHTIRYATFGTNPETSWPWADFYRCDTLKSIQSRLLPPGTNPQLYCGSVEDIPQGWHLCDGLDGRPNLKGQFIAGYDPDDPDYNAIGNTGGTKKVTLLGINMPALKFTYSKIVQIGKSVLQYDAVGDKEGASYQDADTNTIGNSTPFDIRPTYYTLAYIIYQGN
ncbi:hypothetical protein GCM10008015_26940 [Flavobacterium palustre]|uniref:Phage tail collar domain-containing protein n=1 Tax=Flavobacterium palustre TaxID=1476463 RepID=A0ABQ1HP69_9FLAO|nr:hypothetical protein [Flavobacterium palustre]GGA84772.1 hypothetical protein GCM10008015_26940 [Flavobacterium palustre]